MTRHFAGKLAVVTGGGSGIGRELVLQLADAGCSVAVCDLSPSGLAETLASVRASGAIDGGVRITTHQVDVSDEAQMTAFAIAVQTDHATQALDFLFNNAGIAGAGGSMVADSRSEWDRVFSVCWGGVYLGVRVFLPLLQAARRGYIINSSSVAGLWATIGPNQPITAYAAAKFAVRGFTEALQIDLRNHAPSVTASLVLPGHVGTPILINSGLVVAGEGDTATSLSPAAVLRWRGRIVAGGGDEAGLSDEQVAAIARTWAENYIASAPMTAQEAADRIIRGVAAGQWRILVGDDAEIMDRMVRSQPEAAYDDGFFDDVVRQVGSHFGR